MAQVQPAQTAQASSSAASATPTVASSTPPAGPPPNCSWDGEKMLNIYVHDYFMKRGFRRAAVELFREADIQEDFNPPINAPQGLLFEWWTVFWEIFTAKSSRTGNKDALIYVETQHQRQRAAQMQAHPQQQLQKFMGMGKPQGPGGSAVPPAANGIVSSTMTGMNVSLGPGPSGQPVAYPMSSQPNGVAGPSSGAPQGANPLQQPNLQHLQNRPMQPRQYQSPVMAHAPQVPGTAPGPPQPNATMGPGQSPHLAHLHALQQQHQNAQRQMAQGVTQNPPHPSQTPMQPFQMIGGRPGSRSATPQGGPAAHPSPSHTGAPRSAAEEQQAQLMRFNRQQDEFNTMMQQLSRLPPPFMTQIKAEAGLSEQQDLSNLTHEQRFRLHQALQKVKNTQQSGMPKPGPSHLPSNGGPPPLGSAPQTAIYQAQAQAQARAQQQAQQHAQQQQQMQAQQGQQMRLPSGGTVPLGVSAAGIKRNSTSPPEDRESPSKEGSPPDRKRPRRNSQTGAPGTNGPPGFAPGVPQPGPSVAPQQQPQPPPQPHMNGPMPRPVPPSINGLPGQQHPGQNLTHIMPGMNPQMVQQVNNPMSLPGNPNMNPVHQGGMQPPSMGHPMSNTSSTMAHMMGSTGMGQGIPGSAMTAQLQQLTAQHSRIAEQNYRASMQQQHMNPLSKMTPVIPSIPPSGAPPAASPVADPMSTGTPQNPASAANRIAQTKATGMMPPPSPSGPTPGTNAQKGPAGMMPPPGPHGPPGPSGPPGAPIKDEARTPSNMNGSADATQASPHVRPSSGAKAAPPSAGTQLSSTNAPTPMPTFAPSAPSPSPVVGPSHISPLATMGTLPTRVPSATTQQHQPPSSSLASAPLLGRLPMSSMPSNELFSGLSGLGDSYEDLFKDGTLDSGFDDLSMSMFLNDADNDAVIGGS